MLGQVKWSVYLGYCKVLTYPTVFFCGLIFVGGQAASSLCNYWLSVWADSNGRGENATESDDNTPEERNSLYYLGIYGGLGLANV